MKTMITMQNVVLCFIILIGYSSATESNECRYRYYHCNNQTAPDGCIKKMKMCNGRANCPNGDDEDPSVCENFCDRFSNFRQFCEFNLKCQKLDVACEDICRPNQFRCSTGTAPSACVKLHQMCDGQSHCSDGEDEDPDICQSFCNNTLGRFYCQPRRMCLRLRSMCDGRKQCGDCGDEQPENCQAVSCTDGFVRCGEGADQCINERWICNNVTDCLNGWDEEQERCPGSVLIDSPVPTSSPRCQSVEETEENPYASCDQEIPYFDYAPMNYNPGVTPVRAFDGRILCEGTLYEHNWVRSFHQDMPLVTYSPILAAQSENHSMFFGSSRVNGNPSAVHSRYPVSGENVFMTTGSDLLSIGWSMEEITFAWYDEGRRCNFNFDINAGDNGCTVGHFRAIATKYATSIGCGASLAVMETEFLGITYTTEILSVVCQYIWSEIPSHIEPLHEGVAFPTAFESFQP